MEIWLSISHKAGGPFRELQKQACSVSASSAYDCKTLVKKFILTGRVRQAAF